MADLKVLKVQEWLNFYYSGIEGWVHVAEDGYTGGGTISGLIRALQYELGLSMDGVFGENTKRTFDIKFPNGLNVESNPTENHTKKIIYILRGGMYCRGIDGGDLNYGVVNGFDGVLKIGIKEMKTQLGIEDPNDLTRGIEMKAILTTDAYILVNGGDTKIREIQQSLNRKYLNELGSYLATNGLYERNTNVAIKKAIQVEIGVEADGAWGNSTKNALPTLMRGSNRKNLVYLLQYLLYANGFDPNGFDGGFGGGVENAVLKTQSMYRLDQDGICGRQTWCALALSCGDTDRKANACDTCYEITASRAQALKNNGYEVVGRYLSGYIDESRPKKLQEGEIQTIFNAGLKLFVIFQKGNTKINDFNYDAGYASGIQAKLYAKKYKLPKKSVIYFSVDFDIYEDQISGYIIPYFEGIRDAMLSEFKIGVYGPRLVCKKLSDANLSISSFVSDASTGYSCNIGQKIPNNWCYDQFVEIKNFNNDFDIDKVIYNESIEAIDHLENYEDISIEQLLYEKIKVLYYLTKQYADELGEEWDVKKINRYVFNYLRNVPKYKDIIWLGAAGKIDEDYIKFMDNNVTDDFKRENIRVPSKTHGTISIEHIAAIISAMSHWIIFDEEVDALSSWAGDLIQLGTKIEKRSSNHTFTNEDVYKLIGCDDDSFAKSLGFPSANETGFDWEDLEQDIDGINLSLKLQNNTEAYIAIELYYLNEENYKNRIETIIMRYFGLLPNQERELANIAESYTDLSKVTALALAVNLGGYDVNTLSPKLSSQFAKKIVDMYKKESNS